MQNTQTARPSGPAPTSIAPDVAAKLLNALLDSGQSNSQGGQARHLISQLNFLEECYRSWKMGKLKEGALSSLHLDEPIHDDLRRLKRFFRHVAEVAGKEMSHE